MPVEEALQLGQEKGYGGFPVVEDGRLVGVVTESDIVRMMTRVLGVKEKGKRIDIRASNKFGNMKKIMDVLDKSKTILLSMMTLPPEEWEKEWLVVLRIQGDDVKPIANQLESAGFNVTYVG
jgi:acetoin utilization protein AcuB